MQALAILLAGLTTVPQTSPQHICWIERVEAEGTGVRIYFTERAPLRPEERSVRGEIGSVFSPANSGHDGCRITVVRKGGELGVEARAHFFDYHVMQEPQVREEWISALAP